MKYLFGLLGHPVKHSLSPPLHEAALRYFGFDGTYRLLDVAPEHLHDRVGELIEEGYTGFNVTIPHKQAMYNFADLRTPEAIEAGAANTVKVSTEEDLFILTAHNTDITGFVRAAITAFPPGKAMGAYKRACVIGAGGAARAALIGLQRLLVEHITVVARDAEKANESLKHVQLADGNTLTVRDLPNSPLTDEDGEPFSLVVQTTPIGQSSDEIPPWFEHIIAEGQHESRLLLDLVYGPRADAETPLVQMAKARGWHAVDGTDMLVHQACLAFQVFTGELPPFEVMRSALEAARH